MDKFTYEPFKLKGAFIVKPRVHRDERGSFAEIYNMEEFAVEGPSLDFPSRFVQSSLSTSRPGVVRGLHIQKKNPQGKLVFCLSGKILDVGLDLRPESPTYKQVAYIELGSPDFGIYWPPGIAHGLAAYGHATVLYHCTTAYDAESDGGIFPLDAALGIPWPDNEMLSAKDFKLPTLAEYLK